jgi:hypothetical protein
MESTRSRSERNPGGHARNQLAIRYRVTSVIIKLTEPLTELSGMLRISRFVSLLGELINSGT